MATMKAGCYVVDPQNGTVAIIYREELRDLTFPKGHVEAGETPEEAAIREVAEETKRTCEIVKTVPPFLEEYTTPKGEACKCYMYLARDTGHSDNASTETHETRWIPFEEVEALLSYDNLKATWRRVKKVIEEVF